MKSTTSNRSRRRRPVGCGALAKKPRIVRATVERYAPSRAEVIRQCKAAEAADRRDPGWQDLIDWSLLR